MNVSVDSGKVLLAAALVPCAFGPFFFDSYVLPKVALTAVLAAAACGLAAAEGRLRSGAPLDGPLAALALAALASALASPDPAPSLLGATGAYAWALAGGLPCLALYRACAGQDALFAERLARWLCAGSLPVSAYALAQAAGLDPVLAKGALPGGRAVSTLGSPVTLGALLAAVAPLALHAARRGSPRRLGLAALALGAAALAASGTRAAWLGALGGAGLYAATTGLGAGAARGRPGAAALAALVLAAGLAAVSARRAGADLQRVELWKAAGALWAERPLVGHGPASFDIAFRRVRSPEFVRLTGGWATQEDAHCDWLQVLAGLGLLGAAAYAWLHVRLWGSARRALAADPTGTAAAFCGALAAIALQAKLNTVGWIGLFVAGLAAGGLAALRPAAERQRGRAGRAAGRAGTAGWVAGTAGWAVLACGAAAAALALRLCAADRLERLGARARAEGRPREGAVLLERALALAPWETRYALNLDSLLWDAAREAPAADKGTILARAGEVGRAAAELRPGDPAAQHLAGLAELRRAEWGGEPRLAEARRRLALALRLDPGFAPLVEDAARAARAAGDAADALRLEERLSRLLQKR